MKPVSYGKADKIAGVIVDRRCKQYYSTDDEKPCKHTGAVLFKNAVTTTVCSGCSDDSECSMQSIGGGCSECGYHGKVRINFPMPAYFKKSNP